MKKNLAFVTILMLLLATGLAGCPPPLTVQFTDGRTDVVVNESRRVFTTCFDMAVRTCDGWELTDLTYDPPLDGGEKCGGCQSYDWYPYNQWYYYDNDQDQNDDQDQVNDDNAGWPWLLAAIPVSATLAVIIDGAIDNANAGCNIDPIPIDNTVRSITATYKSGEQITTLVFNNSCFESGEGEGETFALTTSVEGQGSVAGAGIYIAGTVVPVTAHPAAGWSFVHWEVNGEIGITNAVAQVTMDSDVSIVAVFKQNPLPNFVLTTSVQGQGDINGKGGDPAGIYVAGTIVSIQADSASGWSFDHWEVNGIWSTSNNPNAQVTMDSDVAVIAVFVQDDQPPVNAAIVEFTSNGTSGTMRINPGSLTLRQITADESAQYMGNATFSDISSIGVNVVNLPGPYYFIREFSSGTMAADNWSTTIVLDGIGTDSNGVAKPKVPLANWAGGRAIPFYTLSSVPGRIFSLNTGVNCGKFNGQTMTVDTVGFVW